MNILYHNARIAEMTVHFVGNPSKEEKTILNQSLIDLPDQQIESALLSMFFGMCDRPEQWQFDDRYQGHELHEMSKTILHESGMFMQTSQDIAEFLTRQSNHPMIKSGELIVARITDVLVDDELIDALAIFKLETQKHLMQVDRQGSNARVQLLYGFDPKQIDKACLILDHSAEDGYRVFALDRTAKHGDAKFWMDDFLRVKRLVDDYYQTEGVIEATRYFVHNHLKPTYEMDKTDEAHIMSRSQNYLQSTDRFDRDQYAVNVFESDELADQFKTYQSDYMDDMGYEESEGFSIRPEAVKKQNKYFRSVIKLDRNFHVYVHGDRSMIRRGVDDTGRKYYMLFFEEES